MKVVLQRVNQASCTIDQKLFSKIERGLCLFVGIGPEDSEETVKKMADKIVKLRIFSDEEGKMNLDIKQMNGSILSISQFTLYADCKKKNRPSFNKSAAPNVAKPLYESFNEYLSNFVPVQPGVFGADMEIALINDGPVTIVLDSTEVGI